MNRESLISEVKGIGAKTEELFYKLGVYTVGDILFIIQEAICSIPKQNISVRRRRGRRQQS